MLQSNATEAQTTASVTLDKTFVTLSDNPPATPTDAKGLVKVTVNDNDAAANPSTVVNEAPDLASARNDPDAPDGGVPEAAFAGFDENTDGIANDYSFLQNGADGAFRTCSGAFVATAGYACSNLAGDMTVRVSNFPLLDKNGDGVINSFDVTVKDTTGATTASTTANVFSINSAEGLVTIRNLATGPLTGQNVDTTDNGVADAKSFVLEYQAAQRDNVTARITSSTDAGGFDLTVRETSSTSGSFEGTFRVGAETKPTTNLYTENYQAAGIDTNGDGLVTAADNVDINQNLVSTDTQVNGAAFYIGAYGTGTAPTAFEFKGGLTGTETGISAANALAILLAHNLVPAGTTASSPVTTAMNESLTLTVAAGTLVIGQILTVDWNADGDRTGTAVTPGLSEPVYARRLNGDTDAIDFVTAGFPANLFPTWPHRPTITAVNGAVASASYNDPNPPGSRAASVVVETDAPVSVVTSPANNVSTQLTVPRFFVEVTDTGSGLGDGQGIQLVIDDFTVAPGSTQATGGTPPLPLPPVASKIVSPVAITGGFRQEFQIQSNLLSGEMTIEYRATATDAAGNAGSTDSNTTDVGNQPNTIRIDARAPAIATTDIGAPPPAKSIPSGAITGQFWDTSITDSDKTQRNPTKARNTSIRVIFNEALDGTSIQSSDFRVDGSIPSAAEWFADRSESVFLTVGALTASQKPQVVVAGDIRDQAGNGLSSLTINAADDGIAPTITTTVTPALDTTRVNIDVSSNETLITPPTITVNGVGQPTASLIGTNTFRRTVEPGGRPVALNIQVTATDANQNVKSSGDASPVAEGAIKAEVDNTIPTPTSTPADDGTVFTTNPFITINWTAEAKEYGTTGANGTGVPTNVPAAIVTDLDTHGRVTLTTATLDGAPATFQTNADSNIFILSALNLSFGEHTVVVNGTDEAGNTLTTPFTFDFTVEERPPVEIPLNPGWNLSGLPGAPSNASVAAVIGDNSDIDTLAQFDPTIIGGWRVAVRQPDGTFAGNLTMVDFTRGLWVHTSSFQPLEVDIPGIGGGSQATPPTINVVAGWNLVPVVTLDIDNVTMVDPDAYLPAGTWTRGFGFDTVLDRFVGFTPDTSLTDDVTGTPVPAGSTATPMMVGRAYWVFFTDATVITP